MKSKLSFLIAVALGTVSADRVASAQTAPAASDTLDEIVVTAQRRSESMQNVPISMQAFTAKSLAELNVATFDDYIKYLPNVTTANNGPGQSEIFMRGLSAGAQPSQGGGSTAAFPNVALYLDNQSGALPGRNLDVYAADLERIEVLEGPQGTLFGSGAQAGVIRYITNQPKINVTEGNVKAGYGVTAHGDPNADLTAVLNLPLIDDKLAVRAVIYSDSRGGYIDNVPATFTRKNTDIGIGSYGYGNYPCPAGVSTPSGKCVPPDSVQINNNSLVARAINPVTYKGMRVGLKYQINDDWDALISQSYQTLDSDGVFYQQPNASDGAPLNPLEVTVFNPSHNNDKFENTAWTLNGKLGDLKAVYTGGYLVRNVDQVQDYTNYARGAYASYYQCVGPTSGSPGVASKCYSPSAVWRTSEKNEHLQNEFRLSTPDDWRLRGIVGLFLEDNKVYDQTAWTYRTVPSCTSTLSVGCFTNIGTVPGTTTVNPGVKDDNTAFYQDGVRETKQTAVFASLDFDIIPKVLTVTAGTRYFKFDNSFKGSVTGSFYCYEAGVQPTGCHVQKTDIPAGTPYPGSTYYSAYNLDAAGLSNSESGFKSRVNVTWHVTPDAMVYYTYSQGFRPGSFNQSGGTLHIPGPDGQPQYANHSSYVSDDLTNNELGWKTELLNHRLQWNGAIYQENWDNVQTAVFQPTLLGNVFANVNGQNFRVRGLETSVVWRVMAGLTAQGSASWNRSEQTNSPGLVDNVPGSVNFGKTITQNCTSSAPLTCTPISTGIFGPIGSPTANAPPLQFSLRVRYEWSVGDYSPFVQAGATHTGHSFTQAGSNPSVLPGDTISTSRARFENPAYSSYDATLGVMKGPWVVSLVGQNLSNSNASTYTSTDQFIVQQTPLRPRVISGNFSYKF